MAPFVFSTSGEIKKEPKKHKYSGQKLWDALYKTSGRNIEEKHKNICEIVEQAFIFADPRITKTEDGTFLVREGNNLLRIYKFGGGPEPAQFETRKADIVPGPYPPTLNDLNLWKSQAIGYI